MRPTLRQPGGTWPRRVPAPLAALLVARLAGRPPGPPPGAAAPAAAANAAPTYGVATRLDPFVSDDIVTQYLDYAQQSGAGWVRVELPWSEVEPQRGAYNFGRLGYML